MRAVNNEHIPKVAPAPTTHVPADELPWAILRELEEHRHAPVYLYAVVDQGRFTEKQREIFREQTLNLRVTPLILDPRFESLRPHYVALVYPASGGKSDPFEAVFHLFSFDSNIISGWITSHFPPDILIEHLSGATYAYRLSEEESESPKDNAFFLSYYDPLYLPLLHRLAPPRWTEWFFGPIISWHYPFDTAAEELWSRITGMSACHGSLAHPVRLDIPDELWDAMISDPLPHVLLDYLNTQSGLAFNSGCYGVRLMQIETLLEDARALGLNREEDLGAYVAALLQEPELSREPGWQESVQSAARGKMPLSSYFD
jgi:hypothetical protein